MRAFLLVEHPGPWGVDALRDARMPDGIGPELKARAGAARTKALLIRRPSGASKDADRGAGLRGVHPPRRALARDDRPRRPARRARPRPRGARRRPLARARARTTTRCTPCARTAATTPAAPSAAGRSRPGSRRRSRRRPGRPATSAATGSRPTSWCCPTASTTAGSSPTPRAAWPGCTPPASSTSTTCAVAAGWPRRSRPPRPRCAATPTSAGSTRSASSRARSSDDRTDAVFEIEDRRYAVAVTSTRSETLQKLTCSALRENPVMHHEVTAIQAL